MPLRPLEWLRLSERWKCFPDKPHKACGSLFVKLDALTCLACNLTTRPSSCVNLQESFAFELVDVVSAICDRIVNGRTILWFSSKAENSSHFASFRAGTRPYRAKSSCEKAQVKL